MIDNFLLTRANSEQATWLFNDERPLILEALASSSNQDAYNVMIEIGNIAVQLAKLFINKDWSRDYLKSFFLNPMAYKPALCVTADRISYKPCGDRTLVSLIL